MNRLITLAMCALILGAMWVVTPGCGTVNKAAYKTTQVTSATADLALRVWADYVAQKKALGTPVPLQQEVQAKQAWNHFQDARDAVITAGIAYSRTKEAGGNTATAEAELNAAVAAMAASSADFINLLQSFGVKVY